MRKGRAPFVASGPFLCLFLASCSNSTELDSEERRQLDKAEAMLNSAPADLANIDAGELETREQDLPASE